MPTPPADLITPADLRAWGACYYDRPDGEAQVARHFAGRVALTPAELVACDVPDADKVWVLCRVLARRDVWLAFDLAVHCARLALPEVEDAWRDRVTALVEKVAGLRGKSEAECFAVETEAWGLRHAGAAALAARIAIYAAAARADDVARATTYAIAACADDYPQVIVKALELLAVLDVLRAGRPADGDGKMSDAGYRLSSSPPPSGLVAGVDYVIKRSHGRLSDTWVDLLNTMLRERL